MRRGVLTRMIIFSVASSVVGALSRAQLSRQKRQHRQNRNAELVAGFLAVGCDSSRPRSSRRQPSGARSEARQSDRESHGAFEERSHQQFSRQGYLGRVGGARRRNAAAAQSRDRQRRARARHPQSRLRQFVGSQDAADERCWDRFLHDAQPRRDPRAARLYRRSIARNDSQSHRPIRRQRADHSAPGAQQYSGPTPRHSRSAAGQGYHRQDGAVRVQTGRRHRQSGRGGEERPAAGAPGALRPGRQGRRWSKPGESSLCLGSARR